MQRNVYAAMLMAIHGVSSRLVPNKSYRNGDEFLGEFYQAERITVTHTLGQHNAAAGALRNSMGTPTHSPTMRTL
jgi:hypothetical protein